MMWAPTLQDPARLVLFIGFIGKYFAITEDGTPAPSTLLADNHGVFIRTKTSAPDPIARLAGVPVQCVRS